MTRQLKKAAIAAAAVLGLSGTAQAGVVTFDDLAGNFLVDGDYFVAEGVTFAANAGLGYPDGLVGNIDTAEAFAFGNAPTNATSAFYAGLNDGALELFVNPGHSFVLHGFDFAFIPPVSDFFFGVPGQLVVLYKDINGVFGEEYFPFFRSDANGNFAFASLGYSDLGSLTGRSLSALAFVACLYDGEGCYNPAQNLAQFALDNVDVRVPEPGTFALLGLGLLGLAGTRRRIAR